jgi:hypothetical protein
MELKLETYTVAVVFVIVANFSSSMLVDTTLVFKEFSRFPVDFTLTAKVCDVDACEEKVNIC